MTGYSLQMKPVLLTDNIERTAKNFTGHTKKFATSKKEI